MRLHCSNSSWCAFSDTILKLRSTDKICSRIFILSHRWKEGRLFLGHISIAFCLGGVCIFHDLNFWKDTGELRKNFEYWFNLPVAIAIHTYGRRWSRCWCRIHRRLSCIITDTAICIRIWNIHCELPTRSSFYIYCIAPTLCHVHQ